MITSNPIKAKKPARVVKLIEADEPETPLYDLGALTGLDAGNQDFVLSLIKIFMDTIPANSAEMQLACEAGNWELVSNLAHKLKSTVDMMRISTITQDIRAIEFDAKNHVNKELLYAQVKKVNYTIQACAIQLRQDFSL